MEFGTAIATVQRGDYAMTLGGWSGLLDTDSNAWSFLHTGGALNRAGYSNPTGGRTAGSRAYGQRHRTAPRRVCGVWQQVSKDLPIIYLWTPRNIVGLSRKVAGFTLLADGLLRLQDVHTGAKCCLNDTERSRHATYRRPGLHRIPGRSAPRAPTPRLSSAWRPIRPASIRKRC